jgi:cytochrome c oxidase cbb3-type subunit 4
MDINEFRTALVVINFLVFVGIVLWAYSGKRKQRFEEAAQLALDDDLTPAATARASGRKA